MPEPTLSLSRTDLRAEIGAYLGYGRGSDFSETTWSDIQGRAIDSCLNSGLHRFYHPPILPGERVAHQWSFLKPTTELTLESGKSALPLPADFGGLEGEVNLTSPTGQRMNAVPVVGVGYIDRLEAQDDDADGIPRCVAIRPLRGTGSNQGQRFELAVYPAADQAYVFRVAYRLAGDVLTAAHPYPYGGPIHRETLLSACLSVAEKRLDDRNDLHMQDFMLNLQASVSHDRSFRPQHLGYNGNGPMDRPGDYRYDSRLVTVGGLSSD